MATDGDARVGGAQGEGTLRRPRERDQARAREQREKTTGGQPQAAGVRFPRAAGGGPLTSSPSSAAPHPTYGHGTRSAQRSAPVGCSGAELASPPCPRPEERHGSIGRLRAGPSEAARGGRGRPLALPRATSPWLLMPPRPPPCRSASARVSWCKWVPGSNALTSRAPIQLPSKPDEEGALLPCPCAEASTQGRPRAPRGRADPTHTPPVPESTSMTERRGSEMPPTSTPSSAQS